MSEVTLNRILTEVSEMRCEQLENRERMGRIETKLTQILGNGQPGWIQNIQTKVDTHEKQLAASSGKAGMVSTIRQILVPFLCSALGAGATLLVAFWRHKP